MDHEQNFSHPEVCTHCDVYYVYLDSLCWDCWHDEQELKEAFDAAEKKLAE